MWNNLWNIQRYFWYDDIFLICVLIEHIFHDKFIHPSSLSLSLWKTGNGESISQRHTYDLDRRTNTLFRKEGWRSERNLNAPLTSRTRMRENVQRQPLLLWLCSYFFDSLFWTHVTQGHGVEHHQTRSQCVTASFSFFFFSKLRHIT